MPVAETKYTCVSVSSSGYSFDPASLGGETSFTLHADGSLSFSVGGESLPGLTWHADGANGAVIDYYDGSTMAIVPTDTGFEINYIDVMLMSFEAEK